MRILKKRIWFNKWFNTAYHFIDLIKNNNEGVQFEVFGTHTNMNSAVLSICNYVEAEPSVYGEDYIDYCISFCKKHKIDIFIPCYQMLNISQHIKEFNNVGTLVLASDNSSLLQTINNKPKFYELCKQNGTMELPQYFVVNTADEFMNAYRELLSKGLRVCVKPAISEGGFGFRIINDDCDDFKDFFGELNNEISSNEVYRILSLKESFEGLMVLEYLDGYEYSIDCLAYEGKLLAAVPRKKIDGRVRLLENVPELIDIARKMSETYKLPYISNVQVKYADGIPKLLEINPRMSGGLHISCLSGINFPYLAIKLLQGEKVDVLTPNDNIMVTQIEKEILLTK